MWEYFANHERILRPQLRQTPFDERQAAELRRELLSRDLDGLMREIILDRANGLTGKTVIHPLHVAPVHALAVVTLEEYQDALDVLHPESSDGGVRRSGYGNKMNEVRPHRIWAERILLRADAFGVAAARHLARGHPERPAGGRMTARVVGGCSSSASGWSTSRTPVGVGIWRDLWRSGCAATPGGRSCWCPRCWASIVAVDPRVVAGFGRLLGVLVARRLAGAGRDPPPGWAAAARSAVRGDEPGALLDAVMRRAGRRWCRSRPACWCSVSRRPRPLSAIWSPTNCRCRVPALDPPAGAGMPVAAEFSEPHSHAIGHLLCPRLRVAAGGSRVRWCWSTTSCRPAAPP